MLTILTICKNDRENLSRTLNSLLFFSGDLKNFVSKIIVKDGMSNDGTDRVLKDFQKLFRSAGVQLISVVEGDSGIFNAMNVAIDYCEDQDLIWFLNAGDTVPEDLVLKDFTAALQNFANSDAMCCFFRSKNIMNHVSYLMPSYTVIDLNSFAKWSRFNTPVHQAVVFKKGSKFVRYSEGLRVSSDSVTIYLNLLEEGSYQFYPLTICNFYLGGLSGTYTPLSMLKLRIREQRIVAALRDEPRWSTVLREVLFVLKYGLQNLMPKRYHVLQAGLRKSLSKHR